MPQPPSIKGSAITELFEDLRKFIDEGAITQADIERHLLPEDLPLLESPISPAGWYCVRGEGRALELIRDTVGNGRDRFLIERGRAQGQRLMDGGLYQQMEYARRAQLPVATSPQERFDAFGRDMKLLITLSGSILNFSHWAVSADPDNAGRYLMEITEAEAYPEPLIYSTEGLIDSLVTAMGEPGLWTWTRPTPDYIRFHMTRSL